MSTRPSWLESMAYRRMSPFPRLDHEEILAPSSCNRLPEVRLPTVGDLPLFDFDRALSLLDAPTFLVQYHTLQKVVLGKLVLTDYEVLFEPLNPNLRGQLDPLGAITSRRLLRQRASPAVRLLPRHDQGRGHHPHSQQGRRNPELQHQLLDSVGGFPDGVLVTSPASSWTRKCAKRSTPSGSWQCLWQSSISR